VKPYRESVHPHALKLREHLFQRVFWNEACEQFVGKWRASFGVLPESRLTLEIGCNAGHVLRPLAEASPGGLFLGLDWKFKQIYRASERAQGIDNLVFLRAYGERLSQMFGKQELDHVLIYFPDPWNKRAQRKNRLLNADFFSVLASLMKPEGVLEIRMDQRAYFEETMNHLAPWQTLHLTFDKHAGHPDPTSLTLPEVTLFERLFIRDKVPICAGTFSPGRL
jgi:tRNA (guanine-N7-)-methyltransferase